MTGAQRLVVFDVDGTLVDSQADIISAMTGAFAQQNLSCPSRADILSIVGLSLEEAMRRLAPEIGPDAQQRLVVDYKATYMHARSQEDQYQKAKLYPGARDCLEALHAQPEVLLGVATGKSKRGLDRLIRDHDLARFFVTQQVADFHPSKPHPSMLLTAMSEATVSPENTVMVGDTSFDMEMAKAAGCHAVGVTWGYHPASRLTGADRLVRTFDEVQSCLNEIWG